LEIKAIQRFEKNTCADADGKVQGYQTFSEHADEQTEARQHGSHNGHSTATVFVHENAGDGSCKHKSNNMLLRHLYIFYLKISTTILQRSALLVCILYKII